MSVQSQEAIKLISAGLRVGIKAYESAMRLSAAGYDVPGFKDFERQTAHLSAGAARRKQKNPFYQNIGHA